MDLSRRLYLQIPFFEQFAANKYCNFKFTLIPLLPDWTLMHFNHSKSRSTFEDNGAAIAQWICLHLPMCGPRMESQTRHLHFYSRNSYYVCNRLRKGRK